MGIDDFFCGSGVGVVVAGGVACLWMKSSSSGEEARMGEAWRGRRGLTRGKWRVLGRRAGGSKTGRKTGQ